MFRGKKGSAKHFPSIWMLRSGNIVNLPLSWVSKGRQYADENASSLLYVHICACLEDNTANNHINNRVVQCVSQRTRELEKPFSHSGWQLPRWWCKNIETSTDLSRALATKGRDEFKLSTKAVSPGPEIWYWELKWQSSWKLDLCPASNDSSYEGGKTHYQVVWPWTLRNWSETTVAACWSLGGLAENE